MGRGDLEKSGKGAREGLSSIEGIEAGILGAIGGIGRTSLTISGQYAGIKRDASGKLISDYNTYKEEYAAQEELRETWKNTEKKDKPNVYDIFNDIKQKKKLNTKN